MGSPTGYLVGNMTHWNLIGIIIRMLFLGPMGSPMGTVVCLSGSLKASRKHHGTSHGKHDVSTLGKSHGTSDGGVPCDFPWGVMVSAIHPTESPMGTLMASRRSMGHPMVDVVESPMPPMGSPMGG